MLALCFFGACHIAEAADSPEALVIVYSGDSATQQRVVAILNKELTETIQEADSPISVKLHDIDSTQTPNFANAFVVTLGLSAANYYHLSDTSGAVVLHALVSKSSLSSITSKSDRAGDTVFGIFLDQPIDRLLKLAKLAIPGLSAISAVVGNDSSVSIKEITEISKELGLDLHSEEISDQSDLLAALDSVIARGRALIAFPDPLVFNRYTVQKILLSTYRERVPVIAFSSALTRAGATISVYSTPEQIGRHISEKAWNILTNPNESPHRFEGPEYFSISVNHQVARSLDIDIPDVESLLESLSSD